ncbi:MAG: His-Xaa-Ser system protein HxsD [Thermodesulfobacteriota bacterium]
MEMMKELESGKLLLKVNKNLYKSKEVIFSAAYKFTDNCYIQIDSIDPDYYGVFFQVKKSDIDLISEVNEFCNELIDQQIRYDLNNSNSSIKELIIKKAFSPFQND